MGITHHHLSLISVYFDAGDASATGTVAIATNAANAAGGTKSWRVYQNC